MMHHCGNPYIVKRLNARTMRIISRRRREIRLVTVDECPFDEERHHARRACPRFIHGDRHFDGFNGPISILRRSFYRAVYTDLSLSLSPSVVIGFARHRAASAREISTRDRSFQPREKFMSSTGCKTSEDCVINKYRNASIYSIAVGMTARTFNFGMQLNRRRSL